LTRKRSWGIANIVMKRLAALVTLPLFLLGGCDRMRGGGEGGGGSGSGGGKTPEPTTPAKSDTILVGEYGSMTGSEATFGQSTHNGIMLAVKEINAAGGINGKKIEVKPYDTQGKTQEAGTAVTRLITNDKVVAVLGEVASSLSIAGGRVAQQYGIPMISPSSTNVAVTQVGDMIFRVCFLDSFQGWVGAKFATENLKAKKAAVLYDQAQAYSKGLKDDFKKAFTEMGGQVTTEQAFSGGDQDFSAQLTSIRDTKPDVIYVPGYYTDVGNVALQARKLGIQAPLLGGDGWDSVKLGEIAGPAIDGSYFTNHYSHEETRAEVKDFVKKYQAEYGSVPDGLAALGYDAAKLLFDAMRRSPSLAGKDLAKAIGESKDFKGVTGNISIDANRNARKSAVVLMLKGGKPTYVATIEPPPEK
jgi:branched-chain amino acid transport system substrate-binding protein